MNRQFLASLEPKTSHAVLGVGFVCDRLINLLLFGQQKTKTSSRVKDTTKKRLFRSVSLRSHAFAALKSA